MAFDSTNERQLCTVVHLGWHDRVLSIKSDTSHVPVSSGRIHANGLVHMIHTQVVMTLFFTLDSLLVTRYFPQLAGDYSVALRFGQLLLFVALSLAQLLLPRLSQKSQDEAFLLWERRFYRILLGGMLLLFWCTGRSFLT